MKNLEKLEKFQLENSELENVLGGSGGPAQPSFDLGVQATGAGQEQINDWPAPGQTTCCTYTSDVWDGSNPGTMIRLGATYS